MSDLVRGDIADAEHGGEQAILQHADVEPAHRVGVRRRLAAQAVPLSAEVHADLPDRGGRRRGVLLETEEGLHLGEEVAHLGAR